MDKSWSFATAALRMGPHIVRNEGPLGLFKGVDASMARQLVYSGAPRLQRGFVLNWLAAPHATLFQVRFGMYDMLKVGLCGRYWAIEQY